MSAHIRVRCVRDDVRRESVGCCGCGGRYAGVVVVGSCGGGGDVRERTAGGRVTWAGERTRRRKID
jgi:hypothetical protein